MSTALAYVRKRPKDLTFGLDDVPPLFSLALLGLQHFIVIAPGLAIVVLIGRAAGADAGEIATMISFSLFVLAISTLLQSLPRIGSGLFVPSCNSVIYVSASLGAAAGGLPLVCGMTLLAGLFQMLFAPVLVRMRRFFPNEIVALSIIVVGIELGTIGLQRISTADGSGLAIGATTFFVSVVLGVFGRGSLRLYCPLIGIAVGYGLSFYTGLVDLEFFRTALAGGPAISLPAFDLPRLEFDAELVLPFAFAAIVASLKTMGAVVTCDKICDAGWVRPNMQLVRRGVLIDGLGTALSGLLGTVGTNSAISNVGVAHASGATSRVIGYATAGWMALLALSPEFTYVFVAMPDPVVGGALVFAACLVLINGLQLLAGVPMDMRRAGVVALPILLAIASVANVPIFERLPQALQPMFSSALSISVFVALLAHAFLNFGNMRGTELILKPEASVRDHLARVEETFNDWQIAHNVKARVLLTLRELLDERGSVLRLHFDGSTVRFNLTRRRDDGAESNRTDPGGSFAAHVSDKFMYRKTKGGTEVISAYYEQ